MISNVTYFTLIEDGDLPMTQCAAVTTQYGSTNDPPQNWLPEVLINITCHGQLFTLATEPPTIRLLALGRDPQNTICNRKIFKKMSIIAEEKGKSFCLIPSDTVFH